MSENNTSYEIAQEKDTLSPEVDALIQEVSSHISIDPEALAQDPLETDTEYGARIEEDPAFFETVKPFLDKVVLAEELKDVNLPNGYGKIVLDSESNTPQNYVSSIALTLAMSELPVQTIESETNLPREEKLGDIISEVHPTFEEYRKDMERILELAITDKDRFLKEFSKEGNSNVSDIVQRTLISQRVRAGLALSLGMAVALSACVQNGVVVTQPTSASESVPITESIPTETEVSATATEVPTSTPIPVPTSTPTPAPTETPEPTPIATKWPPAGPYNVSLMDQEFLTFGHRLIFNEYEDSTEHFPEALAVVFKDFSYESLEETDEGYFLIGSLVAQDRANRGELYPVRIKVKTDMLVWYHDKDGIWTISGEELIGKSIKEKYEFFGCIIMEKEKGQPLLKENLQDDMGIIDQEKWRELRLLVGDLLAAGGETEDYELVFNVMLLF